MKTRGVIIMLVISIVFTITIGAASTPDVVKALMDESSSNIVYNDNEINFFDDNNNQLSTYTYNGLTYVPLRSFAEQTGKVVEWDEASNEISINTKQNASANKVFGSYVYGGDTLPRVSMIQLLANPEKYNNKNVNVQGVISVEFECDRLFLTREDMIYLNMPNSLRLNLRTRNSLDTPIEELEKISGSFVEMEGTFVYENDSACLYDVSYIFCKPEYFD